MPHVWKIAPGRNARFWDDEEHSCLKRGCITVNWINRVNLKGLSRKEIRESLVDSGEEENSRGAAPRMLYNFANAIQEGDTIVANCGLSEIMGIGRAKSGYIAPGNRNNPVPRSQDFHRHAILVDWLVTYGIDLGEELFHQNTVQLLNQEKCDAIADAYRLVYPQLAGAVGELMGADVQASYFAPESFNEAGIEIKEGDSRQFARRLTAIRKGQPQFRQALIERYGEQCQITGCSVLDVLEAAHIKPYRGEYDNNIENGLLLRADVHTLFDLDLIGIHPTTLRVEAHPRIRSAYSQYAGMVVFHQPDGRPSKDALEQRYRTFQSQLEDDLSE